MSFERRHTEGPPCWGGSHFAHRCAHHSGQHSNRSLDGQIRNSSDRSRLKHSWNFAFRSPRSVRAVGWVDCSFHEPPKEWRRQSVSRLGVFLGWWPSGCEQLACGLSWECGLACFGRERSCGPAASQRRPSYSVRVAGAGLCQPGGYRSGNTSKAGGPAMSVRQYSPMSSLQRDSTPRMNFAPVVIAISSAY